MKKLVFLSIILAALAGCSSMTTRPQATAVVSATAGSNVNGVVHFTELADSSVEVHAVLTGVPEGVHGFHVHEIGDCGNNGGAAGMHFNPATTAHGAPTADPHHAGDFGNVTADASGKTEIRFTTRSITVTAGPNSVVGKAVIVHEKADDMTTQPTGNAGARIGCGVVLAQ